MWSRLGKLLWRLAWLALLVPILLILSLRWIDPPTTSFILQHDFNAWKSSSNYAQHSWTDYENISKDMALAVIAAEDQRFPLHIGLDTKEISRALQSASQDRRGASTITQQTAKNLFLWPARSYVRKGLEAVMAITMELLLPKQRILEIYLNIAQTGESMFGVTDAAVTYFKKPPAKLNRFEAARIAATLPNPVKYSATNPSKHVIDRQRWILRQMKQLGGTSYLQQI